MVTIVFVVSILLFHGPHVFFSSIGYHLVLLALRMVPATRCGVVSKCTFFFDLLIE